MLAVLEMIEKENEMLVAKGRKAGMIESKKEIAKKMLQKNMPVEVVVEITGLSKKEIDKL